MHVYYLLQDGYASSNQRAPQIGYWKPLFYFSFSSDFPLELSYIKFNLSKLFYLSSRAIKQFHKIVLNRMYCLLAHKLWVIASVYWLYIIYIWQLVKWRIYKFFEIFFWDNIRLDNSLGNPLLVRFSDKWWMIMLQISNLCFKICRQLGKQFYD